MHILLAEPNYYSQYPPLGLLKLASYHKSKGDTVELMRIEGIPEKKPDRIYVSSLFTYAWKPVHKTVQYYRSLYPDVPIWLGGIYASLMPEHAATSGADHIYRGLFSEAEDIMPDYSLVPEWDGSIIFASRGCIRRCSYCAVPKLEGRLNSLRKSIKSLIYPRHTKVIFWDNNFLASPYRKNILSELCDLNLKVDFNQGLDPRLITEEVAQLLANLNMDVVRLAYDSPKIRPKIRRAIEYLAEVGIKKRRITVYTLFNFRDSPQNFFERVRDLLNWGVVSYPMRYEPLNALEKNKYISPKWDPQRLEMVAEARRVLGYGGAFPPYMGLVKKFQEATNFDEAFKLREPRN